MVYKRVPTQVLLAAFKSDDGADKAVDALVEAMKEEVVVCTNLAIIKKNPKGKIRVKELGNPTLLKGMAAGGVVGTAIGAIAGGLALSFLGPIGMATGAVAGGAVGAPIGAIDGAALGTYAHLRVQGMEKSRLKEIGSSLEPGTSAIVAFFGEIIVDKSEFDKKELEQVKEGTDEFVRRLGADISQNLKDGNEIAYILAVDEDGIILAKAVVGEDAMDFKEMILTTDEAQIGEVKITEEGAAFRGAKVTESGVEAGAAVLTENAVVYEVAAAKGDEGYHEVGAVVAD